MTTANHRQSRMNLMELHRRRLRERFVILAALLLPLGAVRSAETGSAEALQKGLFEEEANHNLEAAMQAYQAVISHFDDERKLAATALFRLGECYRKQGKTAEAKQQYERILRDFSDQTALVKSSRAALGPQAAGTAEKEPEAPEDAELRRLAALLKDSPDLINSGPLGEAVKNRQPKVVAWLLDRKADINSRYNGETALYMAVSEGDLTLTELLLARGADPNLKESHGYTPLHRAVEKGFKAIYELLIKNNADVNACDHFRRTPLSIAAGNGKTDLMQLLLAHGAEVNNPGGISPVSMAIDHGNKEAVEWLLKNKANPNAVEKQTLLLKALLEKKNLPMAELLLSYGADVNKGDNGRSSLLEAIRAKDDNALEFLLSHGANPNPEPLTFIPLSEAVGQSRKKSVELLLKYGADPNRRGNRSEGGYQGMSPLELAMDRAQAPVVYSDVNGFIPASIRSEIVDLLRTHGASDFVSAPGQILMTRKGRGKSSGVFTKDRQGYNRHTLLDALIGMQFLFPDLSRLVIHRSPANGGKPQTEIPIDLLGKDQSIDPAKNVFLEYGDIVEIPERVHSLGATDNLPTPEQSKQINGLFQRTVTFKTGSNTKEITVDSPSLDGALSYNKELLEFLPSTADFSRVGVTRTDPVTRERIHYTAVLHSPKPINSGSSRRFLHKTADINEDLSAYDEVWLLNGDLIEIPEKK